MSCVLQRTLGVSHQMPVGDVALNNDSLQAGTSNRRNDGMIAAKLEAGSGTLRMHTPARHPVAWRGRLTRRIDLAGPHLIRSGGSAGRGGVTSLAALGFERVAQHRTVQQPLQGSGAGVADWRDDNTYVPTRTNFRSRHGRADHWCPVGTP